jgi:hypothetical protein
MDEKQQQEWIVRCAHRLRQRWRTVDIASLEEIAAQLLADETLRAKPPVDAAVEWLRRGIPSA